MPNLITFLDWETTFTTSAEGKTNPTPYDPENFLLCGAWTSLSIKDIIRSLKEIEHPKADWAYFGPGAGAAPAKFQFDKFQAVLDETVLIVAHNAKFEWMWLHAAGFKYDRAIDCTMIREYVMQRGIKKDLGLKELAIASGQAAMKDDMLDDYIKGGYKMTDIPVEELRDYNMQDIAVLVQLWFSQQIRLSTDVNKGLMPTIRMMNEFTKCLVEMEGNGIKIDLAALEEVKQEYIAEQATLLLMIQQGIAAVMGDTQINISSPEQLSQLIYSRKVEDKKKWNAIFNIGQELKNGVMRPKYRTHMKESKYVKTVRKETEVIHRTSASQCEVCEGSGRVYPPKKDGSPGKSRRICKFCGGGGVSYAILREVAGFKRTARSSKDTSTGGWKVDADALKVFEEESTLSAERDFFAGLIRLNQIKTYLKTFVGGVERYVGKDGILHQNYLQCVAATGRLVSRDPNAQNWPRGFTFPIRRCFISRFEGGVLTHADQGQLEYRVAVLLADDEAGRNDIRNKVDAHQYTADTIGVSRQDAKPHTFKPLYGGSTGTEAEKSYYTEFLVKHKGIAEWHERLQTEAVTNKTIRIPSGREYSFPYARRLRNGGTSQSTQIKNYPVQGFATADLVPIWIILLWGFWTPDVKSLLCMTTHDDVVIDTHPDEKQLVIELVLEAHRRVPDDVSRRYKGYKIDIPLAVEVKQGLNLMQLETVAELEIGNS